MRIPSELLHKYPPRLHGENCCTHFKNRCVQCGARFKGNETRCPSCGTGRVRCAAKAVEGGDVCRSHMERAVLSIFSLAAEGIGEGELEELVERDDRDLASEYALAKLVVSQIVEDDRINKSSKLKAIKEFFNIAKTRKDIESGDELKLNFDDKMAAAIRRRFKVIITSIQKAMEEEGVDEETRQRIMQRVSQHSKLVGRYTGVDQSLLSGEAGKKSHARLAMRACATGEQK